MGRVSHGAGGEAEVFIACDHLVCRGGTRDRAKRGGGGGGQGEGAWDNNYRGLKEKTRKITPLYV